MPPENGKTNSSLSHLEDSDRFEVYCDTGYALYGDYVLTCEKGAWSGLVTPECRPEEGTFQSVLDY